MNTYVFSGQGSQVIGMGKEYFQEFPELVQKADDILGYSIEKLCLYDPENCLNQTEYTQPALFVVSMLEYLSSIKIQGKPDFLIGHSIGEYAALCAAGAFSFEDGLALVKERGRLMSLQKGGSMAAVIGLTLPEINNIIRENELNNIDIANLNTLKQTVISGKEEDINNCDKYFINKGAQTFIKLKVSGAFHSRYMKKAEKSFADFMANIKFKDLEIPVISNYTAKPYENGKVKNTLLPQISNTVRWVESINYLLQQGKMEFIKAGPGHTTINLVKRIEKERELYLEDTYKHEPINIPFDVIKEKPVETSLKDGSFKNKYHTKYNYAAGSMGNGISGVNFVVSACNSGVLSFYGTQGIDKEKIENDIDSINNSLKSDTLYGINITQDYSNLKKEKELFKIAKSKDIKVVEISNYIKLTKELVLYKVRGLHRDSNGFITGNAIIAKISKTYAAKEFLLPAPKKILTELLNEGLITNEEYDLASKVSVADDICIVGDCSYETDRGNLISLLPALLNERDKVKKEFNLTYVSRIGASGGIGTKAAAKGLFNIGSDFIMTGSINEATIEASLPENVKDILNRITVNDLGYAPSVKFFEMHKDVQVVKKGLFFVSRANKLRSIYETFEDFSLVPEDLKLYVENKILKSEFNKCFELIKDTLDDNELIFANNNSKYKMALVFKAYLKDCFKKSLSGSTDINEVIDYEIYASQALGALNESLKDTNLENWQSRTISNLADYIMSW